ncbi:acyl-CoA dehydrogenase family protein [Ornithinimicrobium pekingense]|uniref:Acyl-CoA dehydrogenase n=1 Tax=Ornithinimicrobium pekingense TaxID=384677 RepID=A0ABQ2FCD4_9MICO|nr:acyl-CoA dehydrogenase family protein [Ornithinimicrobium pekingense]GGK83273.1 acyl-CoA dehydrogenase [Ornithinimicrobium pekingense]
MVQRVLPSEEAEDLLALVREIADEQLLPRVDEAEAQARFPREVFTMLGQAGLLSLAYPEEQGGGGQPYEVYLQVVEEIARAWMSVAVGVSVHSLTCFPLAGFGTPEQQERWLGDMLSGDQLGAYCLSEPQAGSDVAAIRTRAERDGDGYVVTGTKAWISHAGHADFYTLFARTSDDGGRGLSCFHVPADTPGIGFGEPERKMGMRAATVREVLFEGARLGAEHRIGAEGQGMQLALAALDSGRLGIAAAATGLAQRALEVASAYAQERQQFGRPIADNQGLAFLIADMAAAVGSSRATYLHAARLKDAGKPHTQEASIAKLVATDAAMRVTTDAVQVLGGYGYTTDFPAERFMREAKVTQIFEGTNQIQRLVISRQVLAAHR